MSVNPKPGNPIAFYGIGEVVNWDGHGVMDDPGELDQDVVIRVVREFFYRHSTDPQWAYDFDYKKSDGTDATAFWVAESHLKPIDAVEPGGE